MKCPNKHCGKETVTMKTNVSQWSILNHGEIDLRLADEEYLKRVFFSDICPHCGFMGFVDCSEPDLGAPQSSGVTTCTRCGYKDVDDYPLYASDGLEWHHCNLCDHDWADSWEAK